MSDSSARARRWATVSEHMRLENAHDFPGCMATFGRPRYEVVATGEVHDGAEAVAGLLEQSRAGFPDFRFDPGRAWHADDAVIVEGRFHGTHRGTWRGLPPTSKTVDLEMLIVFEFVGEEMVCERTYFDLGTALRQLGLSRDPTTRSGRTATALNHPVTFALALLRARGAAGPRPVAHTGAEIHNGVSGERLVFVETAASSGGALFRAEITMPQGPYVVPDHVHPRQEERLQVIEGTLGTSVSREMRETPSDGEVIVPAAAPHRYWNAGDGPLRFLYEHRPALASTEAFFLTYYALANDGRLKSDGRIPALRAALLLREVRDFIRPTRPPQLVQPALFALLAPAARLLGLRPW